jgi:hypothetical protein
MAAGIKGTKGIDFNLTLPVEIEARVRRRAEATYSRRNEFLRRFIIDNIDVIDPAGAAGPDAEEHP